MKRSVKFYMLSVFCLLISCMSIEQENSEVDDSLMKKLEELVACIRESTPEEAKPCEDELMQLHIPDTTKINTYFDIRKHFYFEGNYKRSKDYIYKALDLAKPLKNKALLGKACLYLGNAYLMEWDNYKALEAYYDALDIAEETKNVSEEIVIRINIAIILTRVSNPKKALEVCKATLRIIDEAQKNTKNHVRMLTIITDVSLDLEEYEDVSKYVDEGISISDSLGYNLELIDLYTEKGAMFYRKGNYDKAHDLFKTAKDILRENDITHKMLSVNIDYFSALVLYDQGAYEDAIHILKQVTAASEGISGYPKFIDAHLWLAKCYENIDDTDQELFWIKRYTYLHLTFDNEKDEINYEMGERLENNNHKLQKALQSLKKKNKYVLTLLIFMLLLLAGIILLYFRKQRTDKKRFRTLIEKITLLEQQEQQPKEKTATVIIDDATVNKVLGKISKLEAKEYFLSPDCSLRGMGKKVKTNVTYLSRIINEHKGKSFNDYINELRIDYVLKRIKNDEKFRRFSIEGIALEVGYKSVNSFTKHFKSRTGLNPSYYIKNINKLNQK